MILEPLAASEAVLTPDEKELGVVLADIGGGTTEIAVWRGGARPHRRPPDRRRPLHERPRRRPEDAGPGRRAAQAEVRLGPRGARLRRRDGRRPAHGRARRPPRPPPEIAEILEPRAEELLQLLWEDAAREVPARELRAGLVLTGGGAELDGMVEVAEQVLGVAVRRGLPQNVGGLKDIVAAPEWACGVGLLMYGRAAASAPSRRSKAGASVSSRKFARR